MSYSHDQKRKLIRKLKQRHKEGKYGNKFGTRWLKEFKEICKQAWDQIQHEKSGPLIGSMQDLRDARVI